MSSFEADAQHRPSSSSAPVQFDDLSQPNTSCAQAQFVDLNQPSTSSAQAQFVDLNQPSTSSSYAQSDDRHQPATSSSARVHFDDLRQPSTPASAQIEYETETTSSQSSQSTVPEQEVSVWEDEMELQQQKRHTLNETISELSGGRVSPLLSTLNTSWDDISSTQKKYYSRKAKEMISTTLSIISPGQEEELWNSIKPGPLPGIEPMGRANRLHFDGSEGLVNVLVKAYDQAASWQIKRQILSLFANDFTRTGLQELIPGLSKWRIDQARLHATETGKGQPVSTQPLFRQRIDQAKIDHFIEYISQPEFIQDVAFGTKTMKLDSGENILIPAVIRTMIPSRIISQYKCHCVFQQFQPASDRSLWKMLQVCSASMQKSLQGLDNLTADGAEAFDNVSKVVDTLVESGAGEQWGKEVHKQLVEGKRYLKADYKSHVGTGEHCKDHCINYALSDSDFVEWSSDCQHNHDVICERCDSLKNVLQEITEKVEAVDITEEQRAVKRFEVAECIRSIRAWRSHLLRLINQDQAKQDALSNLTEEVCLIIMDWAMKFLPLQYRERMSDFYGKKGRSWHVSALITKRDGEYNVECYVHLFDVCVQDAFSVISIVENLFLAVRRDYPSIKKAYIRSDNASCYHNGPLLLSLPYIGKRTGITPLRYDFSDPQAGKDICDRKIAPMKGHIRRWVNEKHDVTTAENMKEALESHGGLKGCRAAVAKVNPLRDNGGDNKIPGISLLNNFSYEKNGIRAWRSFKIGTGRLIKYEDLKVQPQQETGLEIIQQFSSRTRELGSVAVRQAEDSVNKHDIYSCNENDCILTFKTRAEAEEHMDTGKHLRKTEKESMYDSVRKRWADKVTGVKFVGRTEKTVQPRQSQEQDEIESAENEQTIGWALKTTRTWTKMGKKAKVFLIEHFDLGAETGLKADPAQVSREMKQAKDSNGKPLFKPEEWRTAKQIKGFFSRLSTKRKQQQSNGEEIELLDEDIEALEAEESLESLRNAVSQDMNAPSHPVTAGGKNLCHLSRDGELNSLKVVQLQSICESLEIMVEGSKKRKRTYIEPIEEFLRACSCKRS